MRIWNLSLQSVRKFSEFIFWHNPEINILITQETNRSVCLFFIIQLMQLHKNKDIKPSTLNRQLKWKSGSAATLQEGVTKPSQSIVRWMSFFLVWCECVRVSRASRGDCSAPTTDRCYSLEGMLTLGRGVGVPPTQNNNLSAGLHPAVELQTWVLKDKHMVDFLLWQNQLFTLTCLHMGFSLTCYRWVQAKSDQLQEAENKGVVAWYVHMVACFHNDT